MECNRNCEKIKSHFEIQKDFIHSMGEIMEKLDVSQLMVEGNAFDAINSSDTALNSVKEGISSVDELIDRVTFLNDKIENSYYKMQELIEFSNKISDLSKIIGGISNRSSALSMTASMEAARGRNSEEGLNQIAKDMKNIAGETAICSNEMDETVQAIQIFVSEAEQTVVSLYDIIESQNGLISDVRNVLKKILDASYVSNDVSRNMEHEIAVQRDITDSAINAIARILEKSTEKGFIMDIK